MNNQRGFSLAWVVLIILIAAGVGYFIFVRGTHSTTNWPTYTNTKSNFSIQYPPGYTVREIVIPIYTNVRYANKKDEPFTVSFLRNSPGRTPPGIVLSVYPKVFDINTFTRALQGTSIGAMRGEVQISDYSVDGAPGKEIVVPSSNEIQFVVIHNDATTIQLHATLDGSQETAKTMMSTLKFSR